jgi:hypothetical protein
MNNSSLLLLLKKFDKQQLKDFNNFLKSPFFNTNKALVSLFEYIRKQSPEYKPDKLEKKYINKKIFGKTEYNDGFFRVLMSNLQTLAEEYLAYKGFTRDNLIKKTYLLGELSNLGERKLAEKILNRELKLMEDIVPTGPDEFWGMYNLVFYQKYFYSTQFSVSKANKPDDSLFNEQKYLIYHFLLRLLAHHFYHLNQSQLINYEPKLLFLDEIILFLERNPEYLEFPTLNMTYLRVLLLKNNNIEDLYKLKKAFYESFDKLTRKDSFNIISIIMNFCSKQYYETRNEKLLDEKFEILCFSIEKDLNSFEDYGDFDSHRFYHIFASALELDKIEWTEEFIAAYGGKVEPEKQPYLINMANAMLSYTKGQHDSALGFLSKIKKLSSATDKFNVKTLQLRIFYDMGHIDSAESTADSFRHLVQNDKLLSNFNRELHRNFYTLYNRLLQAKIKDDKSYTVDLIRQINSANNVIYWKWLHARAENLK